MSAFDAAAPTYDADFTDRRLGLWLRQQVHHHLPFRPGQHVLELGCGTGEDALWLTQRGIHVTATDASSAMLNAAGKKLSDVMVRLDHLDLNRLNPDFPGDFDGVFANFGVVNCVADRLALAAFLAQRVRPNGQVALVVMGPVCPWEIGWHLLHGEIGTAFRRWRSGQPAHAGGGHTLPVWYPSPRRLRVELTPFFRQQHTVGIGTLLPPSYLDHLVERWPYVFNLAAIADRAASRFTATISDHYLSVFERV